MCRLNPTPGNKILCTKAALKAAILAAVEEAHEIGFLAGQKEQYAYLTYPGSPDRPAWMDNRPQPVRPDSLLLLRRPSLSGARTWPICPAARAGCWRAITKGRKLIGW
jgi:hypothetical protein